ncbi:MAG TPA: RluA family pseudouridine synthase [Saprospiraceae bacterium]|nr:RluA family pseudouridine synthase [Saprospiraceae bacterium]
MLDIVYEDNHIIAVNKEPGDLVQGDKTGDKTLLDEVKNYIKKKYDKPGDVFLNPVHRLDRPVTGIVIFARTSKALTRLNEIFKNRQIEKEYLAITEGRPKDFEATLVHYIVKDEQTNMVKAYDKEKKGGKRAELTYEMVGEMNEKSLLKVWPLTGRPHQIRAQLKKMGCPILGDTKYGSMYKMDDRSICLHCHKMSFIHPVKKEKITIRAPKPETYPWMEFFVED